MIAYIESVHLQISRSTMPAACDIVTAFTREYRSFLSEAVDSIQRQTRQDWRLHLICDGDRPMAREVAECYAADSRIRVYCHDENIGCYASVMRIFDRLESEILIIQDADDLSLPHRLERTLAALADPAVAAYNAAMLQFIEESCANDSSLQARWAKTPVLFPGRKMKGFLHPQIVHGTLAVRKPVFAACNGYESWRCGADTDFGERLQQKYQVLHSTDVVAKRRLHLLSLTNHEQSKLGSEIRTEVVKRIQQRMQKGYDNLAEKYGGLDAVCQASHLTQQIATSAENGEKPVVRVGFIYPRWTMGGTCRTVVTLMKHCPKDLKISGMAIRTTQNFHAESQRQTGIRLWCGETSPPPHQDFPGVSFMENYQAACQAVVDQSDVILLWGFSQADPALAKIQWKGTPVVVTAHGSCEFTRKMLQALAPYATHYRAVSQSAAAQWDDERRSQVRVVYNGVDLKRLQPRVPRSQIRHEWGIDDEELILGHIGRLALDKNPLAHVRAVQQLGAPWRAVFAGTGNAEEIIRTEAQNTLGGRAVFTGGVEHVGDVFAAIDCFLLASPSEGHCQALNEAWAAGVPVVATRVGAVPELEAEYGSLVVPVSVGASPQELAEAVRTALCPENREVIQRAQQMVHSRFTMAHMIADFCNHMHEIVSERASRGMRTQQGSLPEKKIKIESGPQLDCSIVIPASRPELFPEALQHALNIFPEYREIVVAAAPTITTACQELIRATPRCRTVPGINQREEAAMVLFRAMDVCAGQWIVHVDDNDLWLHCDKEKILQVPEDVAVISGGALYCQFQDNQQVQQQLLFGRSLADYRELNGPFEAVNAAIPGSFRLTRRSAWEKVRAIVPRQFEYNDYTLLLCLLYAGYRLESVDQLWGVVRRFEKRVQRQGVPSWPEMYAQIVHQLARRPELQRPTQPIKSTKKSQWHWAVGMTTAPRRIPTLERSLESLVAAGWNEFRLFAEPEVNLPHDFSGLSYTQHTETLGPFPNWYLSLTELYLRAPLAEAYLLCQDDVLFAQESRDYLETVLWPAPEIGVVSLYCPSHEHRTDKIGFHQIQPGWDAWGALAYVFSNPGLRQFLSDSIVLNHRHHGPAQGLRNIDSVVGGWCQRQQLPYFVHTPSLAQHIGETSTIWKRGKANGRRRAQAFDPEFPRGQLERAP